MKPYTIHVISNTHWDREWRHAFQRMRMDLVELIDRLLDICETEATFKHYHLDSQAIPLEDYLEVRPEKRDLLIKHLKNGKILAGPWYTLPDDFIVSGESVVRNLMRGHKVVKSLGGKPMKVGYTPTSYGQNSQMPQIYMGFGIDSIIFYRGLDIDTIKNSEYIWEGADGTRILGIKLSENFTRILFRWKVWGNSLWRNGKVPGKVLFHPVDTDSYLDGFGFIHTETLKHFNPNHIAQDLENAKAEIAHMATTEHLIMMDGFDATYPHPNSGRIVAAAKKAGAKDTIIHQAFPKAIEAIKKAVDWSNLLVVKGERRTPARTKGGVSTMPGVLTSHTYFKRANHDSQILLEKYAEPLSAMSWLLGNEYKPGFLDLAWKYVIANHPHDTICGASVDQIYIDAMDRFRQSQMISHHIAIRSQRDILEALTRRDSKARGQILTVFNTLAFARTEVAEAFVDFPQEDKIERFALRDADGKDVMFQVLSKESMYDISDHGDMGYPAYYIDRYKIAFLAEDIPAIGWKSFWLQGNQDAPALKPASLIKSPNTMENDFLRVRINDNGTVDLTDKTTKKTYKGLGYFEDGGDAGDPWHYTRPQIDRIATSQGAKAKIRLIEDKPLFAVYQAEISLKVPESLSPDKSQRAAREKTIALTSTLRLTKTSRALEVTTRVNTPVEDHRLRVAFPTSIATDTSVAETDFDVVERKIDWAEDTSQWEDKEVGIQPQQMFVDLTDGKAGLAILNRGLREYEVSQDKKRTIFLTLLRGYRYPKLAGGASPRVDYTDQTACQCKGEFTFHYALCPHEGDWDKGGVLGESRRFNAPLRMAQCSAGLAISRPAQSFLTIEPKELTLSALKVAESSRSLIVRLYNPTSRTIRGSLSLANPLKRARLVNLNEEPLADGELPVKGEHSLDLEVGKKKIMTVELFVKR